MKPGEYILKEEDIICNEGRNEKNRSVSIQETVPFK